MENSSKEKNKRESNQSEEDDVQGSEMSSAFLGSGASFSRPDPLEEMMSRGALREPYTEQSSSQQRNYLEIEGKENIFAALDHLGLSGQQVDESLFVTEQRSPQQRSYTEIEGEDETFTALDPLGLSGKQVDKPFAGLYYGKGMLAAVQGGDKMLIELMEKQNDRYPPLRDEKIAGYQVRKNEGNYELIACDESGKSLHGISMKPNTLYGPRSADWIFSCLESVRLVYENIKIYQISKDPDKKNEAADRAFQIASQGNGKYVMYSCEKGFRSDSSMRDSFNLLKEFQKTEKWNEKVDQSFSTSATYWPSKKTIPFEASISLQHNTKNTASSKNMEYSAQSFGMFHYYRQIHDSVDKKSDKESKIKSQEQILRALSEQKIGTIFLGNLTLEQYNAVTNLTPQIKGKYGKEIYNAFGANVLSPESIFNTSQKELLYQLGAGVVYACSSENIRVYAACTTKAVKESREARRNVTDFTDGPLGARREKIEEKSLPDPIRDMKIRLEKNKDEKIKICDEQLVAHLIKFRSENPHQDAAIIMEDDHEIPRRLREKDPGSKIKIIDHLSKGIPHPPPPSALSR